MAPKYILNYLDIASRGEFIRLIFNHVDVEFEDRRYKFSDIKANERISPLGQLPSLEIDDNVVCQSHAIVRYLANEYNLYGNTSEEKVVIDQVLDTLKNIEENLWGSYFFKKGEEQVKALKNMFENVAPKGFKLVEKYLKANNDGKGFLVGDAITIGDIHIMVTIETILLDNNTSYRDFLNAYPLVKALNDRVRESTNIKNYIEKRGPPVYNFS